MANIYLKGNGRGMTESEMKAATSHANRSISPSLLKEAVAYHNVQSNWGQSESSAPDYIKNKPAIPKYWSDSETSHEITNFVSFTILDSDTSVTGVALVYYDPDDDEEKYRYLIDGPGVTASLRLFVNSIYPVGTYYETSDGDFDPNEAWGGTWEYSGGKWHRTA